MVTQPVSLSFIACNEPLWPLQLQPSLLTLTHAPATACVTTTHTVYKHNSRMQVTAARHQLLMTNRQIRGTVVHATWLADHERVVMSAIEMIHHYKYMYDAWLPRVYIAVSREQPTQTVYMQLCLEIQTCTKITDKIRVVSPSSRRLIGVWCDRF